MKKKEKRKLNWKEGREESQSQVEVVQVYWVTKLLCLTSSCRSWTILNTASGLASFSATCDMAASSFAFGPNQPPTIFAISFGDFENFPHPFSTTYGTFPASCNARAHALNSQLREKGKLKRKFCIGNEWGLGFKALFQLLQSFIDMPVFHIFLKEFLDIPNYQKPSQ